MKPINEIIKGIREDHDLTQAAIASVIGVQQQYYSKYETGDYEIPVRHIITLANYYKTTSDFLLGLTEYKGSFDKLEKPVTGNITAGKIVTDILSLNMDGRKAVAEYIDLLKLKQSTIKESGHSS